MVDVIHQAAARVADALRPWDRRWSLMVQLAAHMQARAFGFQIVNAAQEEQQKGECIPACSAVAADHLQQLLQDRAAIAVGGQAEVPNLEVFQAAIQSLHNEYFAQGPYKEWLRKSKADVYFGPGSLAGVANEPWIQQLAELALYFMLWTEAANLKHTPELLWLIYYIMLCSKNHVKSCEVLECTSGPYSVRTLATSGSQLAVDEAALQQGFVRGLLLPVRNAHGNAMRLGELLLGGPNPYRPHAGSGPGEGLAGRQRAGLDVLKAQGQQSGMSLESLIEFDIDYFGDGCIFLDIVVQPVFNFMAEQIALMGSAGEQPALRLGYDDINESACIAQVLDRLSIKLENAPGQNDAWGSLLNLFVSTPSTDPTASGVTAEDVRSALSREVQRYPRNSRRLGSMAAALKKAVQTAPDAAPASSVSQPAAVRGYGCVGGSAPVGHLLTSLKVTNELWAQLFKKSFVETRSMGAIVVGFSRVYIFHTIMLCCMTLWAYLIPRSHFTVNAMFTGRYQFDPDDTANQGLTGLFYIDYGLKIAECASYGLLVHAVLHVVKDLVMIHLLWAPHAVRKCQKADTTVPKPSKSFAAQFARYADKNLLKEGEYLMDVAPGVHNSRMLQVHNLVTMLFWLACCFVLLDGHVASWPLHALLDRQRFTKRTGMPVWALYSLVYVGLWVVHQLWGALTDALPDKYGSKLGAVFRKDRHRAADFFFPYGNISNSQTWFHNIMNTLLWTLVIFIKFLFDYFVVLQPLADQAAGKLIKSLNDATKSGEPATWDMWAMSVLLIVALWGATAFLIFYDTGLFWQLVSALYSTLILGVHRRVGHIKSWYDLVHAFPGLNRKLAKRMLPAAHSAVTDAEVDKVAAKATKPVYQDATVILDTADSKDVSSNGGARSVNQSPMVGVPPCPHSEALFAQAWNKIIDDLRERDLINNLEKEHLTYVEVSPASETHGGWWLLPMFVAAGAVTEVTSVGVSAATQLEVVCRSINMLLWLLKGMKVITEQQMGNMLLVTSGAAAALAGTAGGPTPRVAGVGDVSLAAEVLQGSKELFIKLKKKLSEKQDVKLDDVDTELLLESVYKSLRRCKGPTEEFKRDGLSADQWNHLGREHTDLSVQRQTALKVINWLLDMLQLTHGEAAPASHEAKRVLCFFATSLHNPNMLTAAKVACTRSMTTLTPHYGEDVMYALSKSVAEREMGVSGLSGGDDNTFLLNVRGDSTETLNYLKVVYKAEWANFVERIITNEQVKQHLQDNGLKLPPAADIGPATFSPGGELHAFLREMLCFASMRGQLLQRTVHGMMYYETALQQLILMQCRSELAKLALDSILEADRCSIPLRDAFSSESRERVKQVCEEAALLLARKKFSYVVSSQNLGEFSYDGNVGKRWLTYCIRNALAQRYPSLKIAYIDLENIAEAPTLVEYDSRTNKNESRYQPLVPSIGANKVPGALDVAPRKRTKGSDKDYPKLLYRQYSVLLQWDQQAGCVKETYRVRLPVNLETDTGVILGEGKPENQNHAAIFCHMETLQTIDCNQDGYLAEALKLPNLLAQFEGRHNRSIRNNSGKSASSGSGSFRKKPLVQGPALVGFREWIFSEDSGAMAEFAAATERSFGTTVQRVMHNPGAVRFHYGHPDVWDKLFTMTNGGVSKSTKSLHVSEDVFGGYNVMLRGRDIMYVDYHAVGKGRDMGFETILAFEGKIAGGNGEQVVSRDIQRLGRRLNFTRLMTWYHTGNGFFINTGLLMFSLLANAWLVLLLALSSSTTTGASLISDVLGLLGGLQLLQLGSLSLLVYVVTVWLEDGLLATLKNVLKQIVAGSFLFYVFRGQTTAHYFNSDVKYGGAKYAATGRGYKLQATPVVDLFQQYARSHMWFGVHLLVLVLVALGVGLKLTFTAVWSYIIVIVALLCAPFWFNPFTWDWDRNRLAAREFTAWMAGHKPAGKSKLLWRTFNDEQLKQAADDDGTQLGRTFKNVMGAVWLLPIGVAIGFAVVGMLDTWWKSVILTLVVNTLVALLALCWWCATRLESMKGAAFMSRMVKFVVKILVLGGLVVMFVFVVSPKQRYLFHVMVRVLYIEFELARMSSMLLLNFLPSYAPARRVVNRFCWIADYAVGLLLLLLLFIGSLFGLLTRYQAAVLFGEGYSQHYLATEALNRSEVGRLAREVQDMQQKQRQAAQQQTTKPGDSGAKGGGGPPGAAGTTGVHTNNRGGGDNGTSRGGTPAPISTLTTTTRAHQQPQRGYTANSASPQRSPASAMAVPAAGSAAAAVDVERVAQRATADQSECSAGLMQSAGNRTTGRLAHGGGGLEMTRLPSPEGATLPTAAAGGIGAQVSSVDGVSDSASKTCSVTRGAAASPRPRPPISSRPASLTGASTAAAAAAADEPLRASTPGSRRRFSADPTTEADKLQKLQPVFAVMQQQQEGQQQGPSGNTMMLADRADSWLSAEDVEGEAAGTKAPGVQPGRAALPTSSPGASASGRGDSSKNTGLGWDDPN